MNQIKEYSETFFLAPGECDPQQRMPLSLLTMRLIQVATYHANQWGVGYETLIKERETWVLSRVAIEMHRYPMVNETYTHHVDRRIQPSLFRAKFRHSRCLRQ